jgi:hypothetical protein
MGTALIRRRKPAMANIGVHEVVIPPRTRHLLYPNQDAQEREGMEGFP